jgi:hypothetical protein
LPPISQKSGSERNKSQKDYDDDMDEMGIDEKDEDEFRDGDMAGEVSKPDFQKFNVSLGIGGFH